MYCWHACQIITAVSHWQLASVEKFLQQLFNFVEGMTTEFLQPYLEKVGQWKKSI